MGWLASRTASEQMQPEELVRNYALESIRKNVCLLLDIYISALLSLEIGLYL